MYSCGHYGVLLLGRPITGVINMFGGCALLIWVGNLFGALNVDDIVVFGVCSAKIFCMVLVICGECY